MEKQILLVVDSLPETDISIARQGEANYRTLAIDIKSWLAEYPLGTVSGIFVRADGTSYPVVLTITDGIASWSPTATETTAAGAAQLVLQITSGSVIGRSATIGLRVVESPAAGATPPAVDSPWISAVIDAAATYPYVGSNGHWFTFDGESGLWVDTNVSAKGDKGDKGDKPVKGTDYWTAADKAEIVEDTVEEININPESKTETMTQAVGKDASGKLWTAPGGGGSSDFDELTNRPSYNGSAMTHSTNIPEVKTAMWDGKYSKPSGGIPDSDIASAATWSAKGTYSKPSGGIPKTDLASAVQTSLEKADSALQEHQSLAAYRTASAQDDIDDAIKGRVSTIEGKESGWDAKYTKPSGGIPASDIASGVIPSVTGKADKVVSAVSGDLAKLDANGNLADSGIQSDSVVFGSEDALGNPILVQKNELSSSVQASLNLADSALQSVPNTYRTAAAQDIIDGGKEAKGKLTINGTEYTLAVSTTDAGTAGYITFVVEA